VQRAQVILWRDGCFDVLGGFDLQPLRSTLFRYPDPAGVKRIGFFAAGRAAPARTRRTPMVGR